MDDNDFILRQIKSFAEGFGMMIGKKGNGKSEIVFEQQQNQNGKIYTDIDEELRKKRYEQAIQKVYAQKFNLENEQYYQLGLWLFKKLSILPDVDKSRLNDFYRNIEKSHHIQ